MFLVLLITKSYPSPPFNFIVLSVTLSYVREMDLKLRVSDEGELCRLSFWVWVTSLKNFTSFQLSSNVIFLYS